MAKNEQNKKNTGLTVAICIVVAIVLVMMFFIGRDKIIGNFQKTNFFERVGMSTPEFVKNHKSEEPEEIEEVEIDIMGETSKVTKVEKEESQVKTEEEKSSDTVSAKNATTNLEKTSVKEDVKTVTAAETETKKVVTTRNANICFVTIDSSGSVNRKIVTRTMTKTDSPLTDCIRALLAGPLPAEASKNAMTLIPEGTKLIGASVKNGVATLNFNESFEFNSYGVEGCIAQLMQVVYTATEFSTVNSVQFLIEGEKKDYLGTEGQWIGSPLSRASFN